MIGNATKNDVVFGCLCEFSKTHTSVLSRLCREMVAKQCIKGTDTILNIHESQTPRKT